MKIPSDMPTVVYSAANRAQAYLLMDWLREQGIEAQVVNDSLEVAGGDLPLGWTSAPKVVVPESQAEKARPLLEKYESRPRPAAEAPEPPEQSKSAWPACPRCNARRPTLCPHCGASGTDFEQAWLGQASDEGFMVVCSTCDEPFLPDFYRTCHRCQHDFGDGISPPRIEARKTENEPLKVWLALAGVVAAMAAVLGYFAWLFSW